MGIRALKKGSFNNQADQASDDSAKYTPWLVTTNYTNLNKMPEAERMKYKPVRTTRGAPRFPLKYFIEDTAFALMPPRHLMGLPYNEFRAGYRKELDDLGFEMICDELDAMYKGQAKPLALLCFCKTHEEGVFCHREIFAEWFQERTGKAIKELPLAD